MQQRGLPLYKIRCENHLPPLPVKYKQVCSVSRWFNQEDSHAGNCSLHQIYKIHQGLPTSQPTPFSFSPHPASEHQELGMKPACPSTYLWAVGHKVHARSRGGQSNRMRANGGCNDPVGWAQRIHWRTNGVHGGWQRPGGVCGGLEVVVMSVHCATHWQAGWWAHRRGAGVNRGIYRERWGICGRACLYSGLLVCLACVSLDAGQANMPYCIMGKSKMLFMVQEIRLPTATKHIMKIMFNNQIFLRCVGALTDLEKGTAVCLPQADFLFPEVSHLLFKPALEAEHFWSQEIPSSQAGTHTALCALQPSFTSHDGSSSPPQGSALPFPPTYLSTTLFHAFLQFQFKTLESRNSALQDPSSLFRDYFDTKCPPISKGLAAF